MSGITPSPQQRLLKYSTLNVNAQEFIPSSHYIDVQNDDVEFFTDACLKELSECPGDFDLIVETFMSEFLDYLKDEERTKELAVVLTDLCIRDRNCQYIGVKLCHVLKEESVLFFHTLLDCCEEKFSAVLTNNNFDNVLIANFVYYLGELYVQFKDREGKRYSVLNAAVIEACDFLLNLSGDSHIYTLLLFLKLVGQSLLQDSSEKLSDIIETLKAFETKGLYGSRTRSMITTLIDKHYNKWDLQEDSNVEQIEDGCDEESDVVFYGPDGQMLSAEESLFLSDCCESN